MSHLKILIVDDNRDLADCLGEVLVLEDYEVTVVYCGEDAVEETRKQRFDLTLMDVKLPGISGLEAFAMIRELEPGARVMLMTGFRINQLLAQVAGEGGFRLLRQPFVIDDVLAAVDELRQGGIVLAVPADLDLADRVERRLEARGRNVVIARSRRQALERPPAEPADVLVLDLRLPVVDALEVYLALKKRRRALPTLVVTGHFAENAGEVDVLGCLFKPFDPCELLAQIPKLCGGRRQGRNPDPAELLETQRLEGEQGRSL